MNILFSVPRLHTNYAAMIQGLVEDGHRVSFIAMDGGTVVVPSDYNVPVYHIKAKKRWFMPNGKGRVKQLYNEKFTMLNHIFKEQKPDLIIARDLQVINMQLSILGKLRGIPTLYYDQIPPGKNRSLKRKIWYGIVHTFISSYRMTTVKMRGADANPRKNTFFIPFAVPLTPVKKEYPKEISVEHPLKIIVVSKLGEKRKNLIFLLKALHPFFEKRTIRLSIYGVLRDHPNDRKNFNILTDFIETHELSEFVDLYKNKTHKNVLGAYSEYDLFILPSFDEPAAISPFEAMSSGLPVIVTEHNGTNYIIQEGKNGFIFSPDNEIELQEKVGLFIKNPDLIKTMGEEALNTVNRNYRPQHISKNIIEIMKSF